jgi:2-keto-4-pentenoate hydratase/2-oxohepta-3-ene-1,7-dioic acid hydratase in catechol pathway
MERGALGVPPGKALTVKLCTFEVPGTDGARVGLIEDGLVKVVDAPDMRTLFERGLDTAEASGEGVPLEGVHLCPPITPKKFFHTAGNFREHHVEGQGAGWSHDIAPWIQFFQNVDALIGNGDPIIYPEELTNELDYELELAVVVSKAGKFFTPEEADAYIGGYVIFNDITARDIQRKEMESGVFSFCKAIDTFCPLGPWITTADEVPDPHDLKMDLYVNGELRQDGHSERMTPSVGEVLAHYSPAGYSAGDVVSLGTVAGVAAFSPNPAAWYLKPGDVIEARIERLGTLTNPVIGWADRDQQRQPALVGATAGGAT